MKNQAQSTSEYGVLIVAHGERGGCFDNARLLELAEEVRNSLDHVQIEAGVLRGAPSIADGWSRLNARHKFIYPFFMSDGFFCNRILPKKVAEAVNEQADAWTMMPPFGVSPLLPEGVTGGLLRALQSRNLLGKRPPLVIAAHGASVDKQSSTRANELAAALRRTGYFGDVTCGFLDEAPHLRDMVEDFKPDTVVLPHFNGLGSHSVDDMAKLAARADDSCHFIAPVGAQPWVGGIITADIAQALGWNEQAEAAE